MQDSIWCSCQWGVCLLMHVMDAAVLRNHMEPWAPPFLTSASKPNCLCDQRWGFRQNLSLKYPVKMLLGEESPRPHAEPTAAFKLKSTPGCKFNFSGAQCSMWFPSTAASVTCIGKYMPCPQERQTLPCIVPFIKFLLPLGILHDLDLTDFWSLTTSDFKSP